MTAERKLDKLHLYHAMVVGSHSNSSVAIEIENLIVNHDVVRVPTAHSERACAVVIFIGNRQSSYLSVVTPAQLEIYCCGHIF